MISAAARGRATVAGVRSIAALEAAKGLLVLAVGFGLLKLLHHDVEHAAIVAIHHLHLNPGGHVSRIFLRAAERVDDRKLVLFAVGAFAYSGLRLAEGYGLWKLRPWAEWLAIASSGLYLPVEVFELFHHATVLRALVLATNVTIVAGLLYVRVSERRHGPMSGRAASA